MSSDLHIITLNNPWPADYGGMVDSFHRIVNLSKLGVKITLHCYSNNNKADTETEKYCKQVFYYPRNNQISSLLSKRPYIVASRDSKDLLQNLLSDNAPVLFDGLHTTALLDSRVLKSRKKIIRTHNIESEYYKSLSAAEQNLIKRAIFNVEVTKLKRFEKILSNADHILAISKTDYNHFTQNNDSVYYSPPFHPFTIHFQPANTEDYVLFHGDLTVNENVACAKELLELSKGSDKRLIIAGKSPGRHLFKLASETNNTEIIADPGPDHMIRLISNAAVNIVPSISANGFRIKLIYSLYQGGHCVATEPAVRGTGLESLCQVTATVREAWELSGGIIGTPYTKEEAERRNRVLCEQLDPEKNAERIISLISG